MRAVLDPNVLIASLLAPRGTPAELLLRFLAGDYELVVSDDLLAELERALTYPKLARRVSPIDAGRFVAVLRGAATIAADPGASPPRSIDPGDDYLIALAEQEHALLVSGDQHLLALAPRLPILSPRQFRELLDTRSPQ